MTHDTILIVGDREADFAPHDRLLDALEHASVDAGIVVNTRWVGNDELARRPHLVTDAAGVLLAPRGRRTLRVLPEATLRALRLVREQDVAFLATGDVHDLVLIEVARNVVGVKGAGSTYFDENVEDAVVKDLPRGRRTATLDLLVRQDPVLAPFLPPSRREEAIDLTHGINFDYAFGLEEAGLRPVGLDAVTSQPHLFVYAPARWHVTAAFLPQMSSRAGRPHPLVAGFLAHAAPGEPRSR
jgi:CTP synthase